MSEHIIRRLKEQTPYTNVLDGELMKEAADELTRLREEIETLKSEESCNDVLLEYARAENKRLRVEIARLRELVFRAFQEGFNSGPGKHDESGTADNDLAEAWDLSAARAAIRDSRNCVPEEEGGEE